MKTKGKLYIILTVLTILFIVVLEYTKPQKINWFPSYASHHKIPFGTFIFQEQLERIFSKKNIIPINQSPFDYLKHNDSIQGTYVFINNTLSFGDEELDLLLNWTAKGNTLFIASEELNGNLQDTLNLKKAVISNFNNIENKYQIQLKNQQLQDSSMYTFNKASYMYYFKKIDTLNTKVVGVADNINTNNKALNKQKINIIKQQFGKGSIIISTFPQAFTNYFLLTKPNQNYTAGLVSYIYNTKPIYVDMHYKSGKSFYSSPIYILLNTKELKWAYYLLLIGVFIYIIFEGKRKQRAIPIIKPLQNKTVDFTRTISNMYYEKGKHKEILNHKINHFLEYIRSNFHLKTNNIDAVFIKQLAAKSNNTIEDTKTLFNHINNCQEKTTISNLELEKINTLMETFKAQNKWKKTKN